MALFTDGPISSIEDLAAQDTQLLAVASTEGIDVTQKLALAHDEAGTELCAMLSRLRSAGDLWLTPSARLDQVVVTPALKRWHTLHVLDLIYSDAYNSQLNDRYAGKRDQFRELARQSYEKLLLIGVGIAPVPVPQAAPPSVLAAQGSLPDATYYIAMSWINAAGEEGAASTPAVFTTIMSSVEAQPGPAPKTASGWNVFLGLDPNALTAQNAAPLAIGVTWVQPPVLASGGRGPSSGQTPAYYQPVPRMIRRG